MNIFCQHCGAVLKLDESRMRGGPVRVKCPKCQNLLTVEPPKPAAPAARPAPPAAAPAPPRPSASAAPPAAPRVASRPAEKAVAAVVAAEIEVEPRPAPRRTHYLQKIKIFSALSYEECVMVESRLKTREFPPNQIVVKEGGPGDSLFFIRAGNVEVRKKDSNTGIDFLLTELKEGACF